MITIHATKKLLKRMRVASDQNQPQTPDNPLGPWFADIDFCNRRPFVVLMNAATGLTLVLPGYAKDLRQLNLLAAAQLRVVLEASRLADVPTALQELAAWSETPIVTANRSRSMAASLTRAKLDIWTALAHFDDELTDIAVRHLTVPFTRKDLGRQMHIALDLLYESLAPGSVPDWELVRSLMLG